MDTSVAIALVQTDRVHRDVVRWWDGRAVAPAGHALAETYSVLTRLSGDLRLAPADAAHLITERFAAAYVFGPDTYKRLREALSRLGVAGGAVDDALVALAAVEHNPSLATRDVRARGFSLDPVREFGVGRPPPTRRRCRA